MSTTPGILMHVAAIKYNRRRSQTLGKISVWLNIFGLEIKFAISINQNYMLGEKLSDGKFRDLLHKNECGMRQAYSSRKCMKIPYEQNLNRCLPPRHQYQQSQWP
jgi:hypothetical protein